MNEQEVVISKHISAFCKALPTHVETWKNTLQDTITLVRGVANLAEQLRYVEEVNLKHKEDFENSKKRLKHKIIDAIEEDLLPIKSAVEKLYKANQDIRNKLLLLENSALNLDWNEKTSVVLGSASVPSLSRLLQSGLQYWTFFQNAHKNINNCIKSMDWFDERSMTNFEKSFDVNLENKAVCYLLAITQYVDNEKNIL